MTRIIQGAEARVERDGDKVVKHRVSKAYRADDLDERIRTQRTKTEANLLRKLSFTPTIHDHQDTTITMQYIEGDMLTAVIQDDPTVMKTVAATIASMHERGIYHGDLTTSNVIIDDEPIIIDFGLGGHTDRAEDKAVDLYLLHKAIKSKHHVVADQAWESFTKGYKLTDKQSIAERFSDVKQRGRYK